MEVAYNDNYIYACTILYDDNKYYWTIITQADKRQYPLSNADDAILVQFTGLCISFLFLLKGDVKLQCSCRVFILLVSIFLFSLCLPVCFYYNLG